MNDDAIKTLDKFNLANGEFRLSFYFIVKIIRRVLLLIQILKYESQTLFF